MTSSQCVRNLGGRKLQQLTKADGDELVEWMLTEGRTSPKRYRPGSLAARVVELIERHPEGIAAATIAAAFPEDDVHTCLSGLLRASRVSLDSAEPSTHSTNSPRPKSPHMASSQLRCVPH